MKPPDQSKIKCILFDLGSTLIEYENNLWDKMSLMALEAGYKYLQTVIDPPRFGDPPPSLETITAEYKKIRDKNREYSGQTLKEWNVPDKIAELFDTVGIKNNESIVPEFFSVYYKIIADQLTIFDDTIDTLDQLKKAGLIIGLVSNTIFPAEYHRQDLQRFGIINYFDFMLFSSSFGYRKPHRSIYEKAVELSGFNAENSIFVGDRYAEDYLGPRENGIFSILKYRDGREYPKPFPDDMTKIGSLHELLPYCLK